MSITQYTEHQLILDISTILKDISQGINDLQHIISLVSDEKEIISFENFYCKQCKEPCGRSNAEILKCVTTRKNNTQKKRHKTNEQYTKEYLEQDLNEIIIDLQKKEKHLKQIVEKIQKGIIHS
jgi:flagellar hook-basal body complex protein FliE